MAVDADLLDGLDVAKANKAKTRGPPRVPNRISVKSFVPAAKQPQPPPEGRRVVDHAAEATLSSSESEGNHH